MPSAAPPSRDLAIVSLGLGIFSVVCGGITFGIAPIGGIGPGLLALGRAPHRPGRIGGAALAIAGIVISVVALVLIAVFLIVALMAPDRPR